VTAGYTATDLCMHADRQAIEAVHVQYRSPDDGHLSQRNRLVLPFQRTNSLIKTRKQFYSFLEVAGFRLIPTSMTLNDRERRNSYYFAFFYRIR